MKTFKYKMQQGGIPIVSKPSSTSKPVSNKINGTHGILRDFLFNSIDPVGTDDGFFNEIKKVIDDWKLGKVPSRTPENSPMVDDAFWAKYLELPYNETNLQKSPYKPTTAKNPNSSYYRINPKYVNTEQLIKDYGNKPVGFKTVDYFHSHLEPDITDPIQNMTVSRGKDEKGDYISIYDVYDLKSNPFEGVIGKPFEIYDRIYIPPVNKHTIKQQGGVANKLNKYLSNEYAQQGLSTSVNKPVNPFLIQQNQNQKNSELWKDRESILKSNTSISPALKKIYQQQEGKKAVDKNQDRINKVALATSPIPVVGQVFGSGAAIANGFVDLLQGDYGNVALDAGLAALPYGIGKYKRFKKELDDLTTSTINNYFNHLNVDSNQLKKDYRHLYNKEVPSKEIQRILNTKYSTQSSKHRLNKDGVNFIYPEDAEFNQINPMNYDDLTSEDLALYDAYTKGSDAYLNLRPSYVNKLTSKEHLNTINQGREILNKAIQKQKIKDPITVKRDFGNFTISPGNWKNHIGEIQQQPIEFKDLPEGSSYLDKGFVSTTLADANGFDKINLPGNYKQSFAQINALPVDKQFKNFEKEREVLLPNNLWLKYLKKDDTSRQFDILNPYTTGLVGAGTAASINTQKNKKQYGGKLTKYI